MEVNQFFFVNKKTDQLRTGGKHVASLVGWVLVLLVIMMLAGMDAVCTPSVALEGKTLWILRSLPVDARAILDAIMNLQIKVNAVPSVLCAAGLMALLAVLFAALTLLVRKWLHGEGARRFEALQTCQMMG
ncbi:MAG: hypothetical protein PUD81_07620 [Eggerthellales bacterium]|nr:hypothetical protein [Eggerthellales bacterium]